MFQIRFILRAKRIEMSIHNIALFKLVTLLLLLLLNDFFSLADIEPYRGKQFRTRLHRA